MDGLVRLLASGAVFASAAACGDGGGRPVSVSGVTVLVSEPAEAGMDALHAGRLEVIGGCLGAGGAVIVWPHGTEVVQEDPLLIEVPEYGAFAIGDHVEIGGGFVIDQSPEDHVEPGPLDIGGVMVPAECVHHDVFLAH